MIIQKTISSLGVIGLLLGLALPSMSEELDGATLYTQRTCIACHGPDAKTPILPEYPKLAGQNAAYALQQMKDIKSGARSNGNTAAMSGVMHLVTDEEMQAIANWIASLD
ncbi:MAG: cytochrome c [Deltaproteobacteria bacterium]|nr:cytochrome c [Deltaproteobacteria bacterium]MBW2394579.1 cytochrome c [Deltaproteobacteria bacterium]